jgi:hypothetical protein
MNLRKLDISSRWPILGFCLGDLIGGFQLQFHTMKSSPDIDDIPLEIASGPHNPVLQGKEG